MRSDLATIERSFAERVEAERAAPTVPRSFRDDAAKLTTIAGFEVHDKKREARILGEGVKKRIADLAQYMRDVEWLHAQLKARGVTPLAIVPLMAWRKCCTASGLFFCDSRQASLNLGLIVSHLVRGAGSQVPARAQLLERLKREYTPQQLLHLMAHQGHRLGEYRAHPSLPVQITLPTPPQDVVDVLVKVQDLHPKTVAEFSAIMLAPTMETICERIVAQAFGGIVGSGHVGGAVASRPAGVVFDNASARAAGYEDYEDWRRRCPIISVEHGLANAVVAQFGNFPIEQDVVARAVAGDIFEPIVGATSPEVDDDVPFDQAANDSVLVVGRDYTVRVPATATEIRQRQIQAEYDLALRQREEAAVRMAQEMGAPTDDPNYLKLFLDAVHQRTPKAMLRRMIGLS
jgi:hypothetical protein